MTVPQRGRPVTADEPATADDWAAEIRSAEYYGGHPNFPFRSGNRTAKRMVLRVVAEHRPNLHEPDGARARRRLGLTQITAYGIATIERVAVVIHRDLNAGQPAVIGRSPASSLCGIPDESSQALPNVP